jgi:hypothetical protein
MTHDIWGYSAQSQYDVGTDLTGYRVEATDGHIGKVDEATYDDGSAYIVVNTKPWLLGKHVMLPAGTITSIRHAEQTIHIGLNKDQIKDAPEYDPDKNNAVYRTALGSYYGTRYTP